MKSYRINEVFYSLQGEGVRAGTANVFVRFSGCNLTCTRDGEAGFDCDTEFTSGRTFTAEELLAEAMRVGGTCRSVIFTGGEPMLHLDDELLRAFKRLASAPGNASGRTPLDGIWHIAVETNGTLDLPSNGIDWVCVSPKSAEHTLRVKRASEVKYVRHAGQGIPRPTIEADHYLISPAFETLIGPSGQPVFRPLPDALAWCIQLVKENPKWRLSVQQHKTWGVR